MTLTKEGKGILFLAVIGYVFIFFWFYPMAFLYRDESNYMTLAYLLREGKLFIPFPEFPIQAFAVIKERLTPLYPLGNAGLILPWTFLGWQSIFLHGLLFHLAGTWLIQKLAQQFNIQPALSAILYLFYPPFIFYSRTLMADIPSTVFFMAACYFYFKEDSPRWLSGIMLGLSLLLRVTNVLLVIPFLLFSFVEGIRKKDFYPCGSLLFGILPFAAIEGTLRTIYYGSPFTSGYLVGFLFIEQFSPAHFWSHIMTYFGNLMVCYPFMLIAFVLSPVFKKKELKLLFFIFLIFFSFYYFIDRFPNPALTLVFANRFLFPMIPFFILGYAYFVQKMPRLILCLGIFLPVFLMSVVSISTKHQNELEKQAGFRKLIYETTPMGSTLAYDPNAAELLQKAWGKRRYIPFELLDQELKKMTPEDFSKGIYLIKQDVPYADIGIVPGISQAAIERLRSQFKVTLVAQKEGLEIMSLNRFEGIHS